MAGIHALDHAEAVWWLPCGSLKPRKRGARDAEPLVHSPRASATPTALTRRNGYCDPIVAAHGTYGPPRRGCNARPDSGREQARAWRRGGQVHPHRSRRPRRSRGVIGPLDWATADQARLSLLLDVMVGVALFAVYEIVRKRRRPSAE